jgi:hypothetical protein
MVCPRNLNIHPLPWYKKYVKTNQGAFPMPPAAIQVLKAVISAVAAAVVAILASSTTSPPNDNGK